MKRMILSIVCAVLLCLTAAGCQEEVVAEVTVPQTSAPSQINTETYQWEIQGDTALLAGIGKVRSGDLVIPATICLVEQDGMYVEEPVYGKEYRVVVKSDAFAQCKTIKTVTFEDGVTIQDNQMSANAVGMFQDSVLLREVRNIPDSVTSMAYAFDGCRELEKIDGFPQSVTDLQCCFRNCSALEIAPSIPKRVEVIRECFKGCVSLKTVGPIRAQAPEFIGVFYGCTELETMPELPDTATNLSMCFYGCTSLKAVEKLPAQVQNLNETFLGCESLQEVVLDLPEGVTDMNATFSGCTGLTQFSGTFPESIRRMNYTFQNCSALQSVSGVIPETVTSMKETFKFCAQLTQAPVITYGSNWGYGDKWIMHRTFLGCEALQEIRLQTCPNTEFMISTNLTQEEVLEAVFCCDAEVRYLLEHTTQGLCENCNTITGVFEVDGLDVWVWDVTQEIFDDAMDCLKNQIPQELKDANRYLIITVPYNWESCLKQITDHLGTQLDPVWLQNGGLNVTMNGVSYSCAQVFYGNQYGIPQWSEGELRTVAHELAHGYDSTSRPKYSQTAQWIALHEAEGEIIRKVYYDESQYLALSEYDRREETFAMANEAYFGNPQWLKEHCPQMYAYMEAHWKDKK